MYMPVGVSTSEVTSQWPSTTATTASARTASMNGFLTASPRSDPDERAQRLAARFVVGVVFAALEPQHGRAEAVRSRIRSVPEVEQPGVGHEPHPVAARPHRPHVSPCFQLGNGIRPHTRTSGEHDVVHVQFMCRESDHDRPVAVAVDVDARVGLQRPHEVDQSNGSLTGQRAGHRVHPESLRRPVPEPRDHREVAAVSLRVQVDRHPPDRAVEPVDVHVGPRHDDHDVACGAQVTDDRDPAGDVGTPLRDRRRDRREGDQQEEQDGSAHEPKLGRPRPPNRHTGVPLFPCYPGITSPLS